MNKRFPIYVILDNIRSALNVGAIFRTCDAANIKKLFLCGITAYPPHNKIPKTALGAIEYVPWQYTKTTSEVMQTLNQCTIVAVENTSNAISIWNYEFQSPTAFIFGNEITGIEKGIIEESDTILKIPMFGKKKSLNVATSVGIVLFEVVRTFQSLKNK